MTLIPDDDKQRKSLPLWRQVFRYFPKALREITKVSVVNNVRYNPDREPTDISWARGKSNDQLGSAFRHMLEREVDGKIYEHVPKEIADTTGFDRTYVLAAAAWRMLAALELDIEAREMEQQAPLPTILYDGAEGPDYQPLPIPSDCVGEPFYYRVDKCPCDYCWRVRNIMEANKGGPQP